MRHSINWPSFTIEYPWDREAELRLAEAEQWCAKNIHHSKWHLTKRTSGGNVWPIFRFRKHDDMVMFKMVWMY